MAESFLPHMNGVTGSVLQVLRHLERAGHEALVIAPRAGEQEPAAADLHGARSILLPSVPLPGYPEVRVAGARAARLAAALDDFGADVVHLASPFALGWQGMVAADMLRLPTVAVYQTDVIAYAGRYGVAQGRAIAERHVARLHRRATLTLAPSSSSVQQLQRLHVDRVRLWGRGVDADRFHPGRRDERWRREVAGGERIVGYVGRLAPEKQVEDLAVLADVPGVRLVIVGDGPSRPALERMLPTAVFTGRLDGQRLAEVLASFDVFVHPGESETFGQTIQEAQASGVPVVATGRGGPVDLVDSSVTGWLYRPGDLDDLRARVLDLVGDERKRVAFADAARRGAAARTWEQLCTRLVGHYDEARRLRPLDDAVLARGATRHEAPVPEEPHEPRWRRYVALGDSLTEGLCDRSRMPASAYRGWADRLAGLLAHSRPADGEGLHYANLAVRSRRVRHVVEEQIPHALRLRPDLVSILIGANDLVGHRAEPVALAAHLEAGVRTLRAAGIDVLLVTPFLPRRAAARMFARRFAEYASQLRRIAAEHGAMLLDLDAHPRIAAPEHWAHDRVHLSSEGHRFLGYRAAEVLAVPDADTLADLDAALHADTEPAPAGTWLMRDALPWVWRRMRGRTAGDGLVAKHEGYVRIAGRPAARKTGRSVHEDGADLRQDG